MPAAVDPPRARLCPVRRTTHRRWQTESGVVMARTVQRLSVLHGFAVCAVRLARALGGQVVDVASGRSQTVGLPAGRLTPRRVTCAALAVSALVTGPPAVTAQSPGPVTGQVRNVVVESGQTLRGIASRYGIDPSTIAHDNAIVATSKLVVGQRLRVDARHIVPPGVAPGVIVVNVPQRMVFLGDAAAIRGWPVAVGRRSWPTPRGPFTVVTKEPHPTWDVPASIMEEARRAGRTLPSAVPPGPDNPLGDYWVGLSLGGVGIHGTNAPSSIYQAVTHGCIRLHPDDIAMLFAAVHVGMRGVIIYEPVLLGEEAGDMMLEVHPDVYHRGPADVMAYVRARIATLGRPGDIDWDRVSTAVAEKGGVPRRITVRQVPRGQPQTARLTHP